MNTLIENSSLGNNLILKKVKVSSDINTRIDKYRIKRISDTGKIINVNDILAEIIEKGLSSEGFISESE